MSISSQWAIIVKRQEQFDMQESSLKGCTILGTPAQSFLGSQLLVLAAQDAISYEDSNFWRQEEAEFKLKTA